MKSYAPQFRQLTKRLTLLAVKSAVTFAVFILSGFLFMDGYSRFDSVTFTTGKQPTHNRYFLIATAPGSSGKPFDLISWDDVEKHTGSFLLPNKKERYRDFESRISDQYSVLEDDGREQLIEVHHRNSDYDAWSTYRVSAGKIIPISFRITGPGHAIVAVPVGIAGTFLFWFLVRLIRERHGQRREP